MASSPIPETLIQPKPEPNPQSPSPSKTLIVPKSEPPLPQDQQQPSTNPDSILPKPVPPPQAPGPGQVPVQVLGQVPGQFVQQFRPQQFTPYLNYQIQPPGVNPNVGGMMGVPPPGMGVYPGGGGVGRGGYVGGGMVNGYTNAMGMVTPPGIPLYPNQYANMVRPSFPPRPPGTVGMLPPLLCPPVPGIRGVPPLVRPIVPIVAPTEKPQTTVYVGKISLTVENDFILSLLRLCGPVKSWKRAQDPSDGSPKSFGFCEFEAAEGVLRALRLLNKFSVDGQELMVNVNQATREYLERYVDKKTEREKSKETEGNDNEEEEGAPGVVKSEPLKPSKVLDESKETNDLAKKDAQDSAQNFGVVTSADQDADRDALEKLKSMLEERLKTKPLPPPPPQLSAEGSIKSNWEAPSRSKDGGDSDVDMGKSTDDKNDDETSSDNRTVAEHETSSPDRNGRNDRSKERGRERDLKRVKERELERYERERERERIRKEREREAKIYEAERVFKDLVKAWESRERDKEYQRQSDRDKEKERERERKREIADQEDDSDDDSSRKRRRRSSALEEKKKKRYREKEDDLEDRLREEEEIVEAKKRASKEEERKRQKQQLLLQQQQEQQIKDEVKHVSDEKNLLLEKANAQSRAGEQSHESIIDHAGDVVMKDISDDAALMSSDIKPNSNIAPAKKLGFGIAGTGKRTTVLSVFREEDDEEANKNIKMKPLVPIDYSTEEIQAIHSTVSGAPPPTNFAAAAEFAKRISNVQPHDDRSDSERERSRRPNERSSHLDRNDEESNHSREDNRERSDRERDRARGSDKLKTSENKKLLDAKQLIDTIPKTKDELFSYVINWEVYDKHRLYDRMKPWISKKITEFLGEEEATLVDYIVTSTKEHVKALKMLELLRTILDDEAEMFVLKMWRMLIFEIKKVETGLSKA